MEGLITKDRTSVGSGPMRLRRPKLPLWYFLSVFSVFQAPMFREAPRQNCAPSISFAKRQKKTPKSEIHSDAQMETYFAARLKKSIPAQMAVWGWVFRTKGVTKAT